MAVDILLPSHFPIQRGQVAAWGPSRARDPAADPGAVLQLELDGAGAGTAQHGLNLLTIVTSAGLERESNSCLAQMKVAKH